jgi:hypothetical protein
MVEEVPDLLERYPELNPRERQSLKNWLREARFVHFAELLSDADAAANLSRARHGDAELRKMLRAQSHRQLGYLIAALLTLAVFAVVIIR